MIQKMGKRLKDQRGLTLIELLAVIVILGIIAAIAIPSIGNIIAKSKFDASKADAIQILNAADLYMTETGTTSETGITADKLSTYVKEVNNLDTGWTVDIEAGTPKINATTKNPKKDGNKHTWAKATKSDVDRTEYKTAT